MGGLHARDLQLNPQTAAKMHAQVGSMSPSKVYVVNDKSFTQIKLIANGAHGDSGKHALPHVGEAPKSGQERRAFRLCMEGRNAKALQMNRKTAVKMHAWVCTLSHRNDIALNRT